MPDSRLVSSPVTVTATAPKHCDKYLPIPIASFEPVMVHYQQDAIKRSKKPNMLPREHMRSHFAVTKPRQTAHSSFLAASPHRDGDWILYPSNVEKAKHRRLDILPGDQTSVWIAPVNSDDHATSRNLANSQSHDEETQSGSTDVIETQMPDNCAEEPQRWTQSPPEPPRPERLATPDLSDVDEGHFWGNQTPCP